MARMGWAWQAGLGGTGLDKFRHGMVRQANTHGKTEAVSISVITKMRKVFSYGWYQFETNCTSEDDICDSRDFSADYASVEREGET